MEMRMAVVLALLLWGISHDVEGGGDHTASASSISEEDDMELELELRRRNKPAVKSIETANGDIFDCVEADKQPAFDHPLLKDHKFQAKPSAIPIGLLMPTTNSSVMQSSMPGLPDGGCPEGTVPIKRLTKRDLIFMKTHKKDGSMFRTMNANTPGYHLPRDIFPNKPLPFQLAYTQQVPGKYYGARGGISLHRAPAANHQMNRAMMTVSSGSPDKLNALQVGWMVNKDAYLDGATRMFIFWTADSFDKTGCRDLFCPGFVQVDKSVAPGMAFPELSTIDGPQHDIYFMIAQMNETDPNWWLMSVGELNVTPIGYWPKALFPDMKDSFTKVEWGGYVYNNDPKATVSPLMGSGEFPDGGYGKAAYFRYIEIKKSPVGAFEAVLPEEVTQYSDTILCYGVRGNDGFPGRPGGYSFYYGGPGGANCGP